MPGPGFKAMAPVRLREVASRGGTVTTRKRRAAGRIPRFQTNDWWTRDMGRLRGLKRKAPPYLRRSFQLGRLTGMKQKIQVLLRTFEGEYHYPNGLLADAADYIDALEAEIERLQQPAQVMRDVNGVEIGKGE